MSKHINEEPVVSAEHDVEPGGKRPFGRLNCPNKAEHDDEYCPLCGYDPVPRPGAMETISARYQMTMVLHLNDDEFDFDVQGQRLRVFEVNVSIRETGEVSTTLKFRGKKRKAWTCRFDALPQPVQDEIQRVYSEHRAAMPEHVFPTLSRA